MKFRIAGIVFTIVIFSMAVCGCDDKEKENAHAGPVLAKVNDTVITPDDFIVSMQLLYFPSERAKYDTPEGRQSFLKLLTTMELFYQEGKRQGINEDPRMEKVVENFRRYLIYHAIITQNINSETIKGFFQRNFFHVALIKIAKPEGANETTITKLKAKAEKLFGKLKEGADFAKTAKKYSDHPTAQNGGDPGPITFTKDWPVEVLRVAGALREVGDVSPVIETPDGFYIIKLIEPYGNLDMAGLTDDRHQFIYNFLLQQNFKNYATQLRMMADVKLYPEVLQEISSRTVLDLGAGSVPSVAPPGVPAVDRGK